MRSIIDATQREQRHGLAWGLSVGRDVQPNKTPAQWIHHSNTKAPWSEARGPGIGAPGPWSCGSTVAIRHSNPYFSAVKYLHFRRCVIVTTLNKASVLDEIWVLARLDPPINNWVRLTMKPKWNLLGEKSLISNSSPRRRCRQHQYYLQKGVSARYQPLLPWFLKRYGDTLLGARHH